MNTQTFHQRVKRTVFAAGKCFLIVAAFCSVAASAQQVQEADVSVFVGRSRAYEAVAGETGFLLTVNVNRKTSAQVTATGVTVDIVLPNGAVPTLLGNSNEICQFAGGVISCDLGELRSGSIDYAAAILFTVKSPNGSRNLSVTAQVTANEFDPFVDNNISTATVLLGVTRNKRTRIF